MSIYDKPTKTLMRDFVTERLKPGQLFSKRDAIAWFGEKYPKLRRTTIDMHVNGMSVNNPVRKHHRNVKPGSGHDLFFKEGPDRFRLWDAEKDSAPLYASSFDEDVAASEIPQEPLDSSDAAADAVAVAARTFALERDLQNYVARNLSVIEQGLGLYDEDDGSGFEFAVGGRRIDLLCEDRDGGFVVIEMKVAKGYDHAVGQILRYMAWVKANLAEGRRVRGIIVASEISSDLKLAASMVPDIALVEYEIAFTLRRL